MTQSTLISSRTNLANGRMFCSADAASSASRYDSLADLLEIASVAKQLDQLHAA
jgi:hypothetical protein